MIVTLDDFIKPKKAPDSKVEYTVSPGVDEIKAVKEGLLQITDEALTELAKNKGKGWGRYKGWSFSLTLEGKKLVKRLMLEGKINMNPKPYWWDDVDV
ncbi:MAG: hypothetical protein AB1485_00125 [Candidatus Thermoplasmatota archaeon]